MALVDTFAPPVRPNGRFPTPFGWSWSAAICCSEVLFVLSRAGAQGSVNLDNVACWLAGLTPFVVQYLGQRFLSWRSAAYVEIWMLSLGVYLAMQFFDLAHFIEYPLYLRIDIGFGRSLASACVYVGMGVLLFFVTSMLRAKAAKTDMWTPVFAAALAAGTLSIALFQPF